MFLSVPTLNEFLFQHNMVHQILPNIHINIREFQTWDTIFQPSNTYTVQNTITNCMCGQHANARTHTGQHLVHPATQHGHTKVTLMAINDQPTSLSFYVNWPCHSWNKAISNFDVKTSRSRSCVWSKGKVIYSAQYLIDWHPLSFTSIRPTIPEIQLFWNLTLQNPGPTHGWGHSRQTHNSSSIQLVHFFFISHQADQPFLHYGQ